MDGFLRYTATKCGMGGALQLITASDSEFAARVRARLTEPLDVLVGAAGAVRGDARADEVLRALGAIWVRLRAPIASSRPAASSTCSWTASGRALRGSVSADFHAGCSAQPSAVIIRRAAGPSMPRPGTARQAWAVLARGIMVVSSC